MNTTENTMNYDPNITWAKQTVRLTFGTWDYRKVIDTEVGGNCKGLSVIETAITNAWEDLPGQGEDAYIVLEKGAGETLECSDEDGRGEDWLHDMLISAEIIAIRPEDDQP